MSQIPCCSSKEKKQREKTFRNEVGLFICLSVVSIHIFAVYYIVLFSPILMATLLFVAINQIFIKNLINQAKKESSFEMDKSSPLPSSATLLYSAVWLLLIIHYATPLYKIYYICFLFICGTQNNCCNVI